MPTLLQLYVIVPYSLRRSTPRRFFEPGCSPSRPAGEVDACYYGSRGRCAPTASGAAWRRARRVRRTKHPAAFLLHPARLTSHQQIGAP
eukprot:6440169-Prymnesium_polylepis.2